MVLLMKNKTAIKLDQLLRAYDLGDTEGDSSDATWSVRIKYHQLYYHYKPGKIYWLLWIIYRKVAIAVVATYFYSNPGECLKAKRAVHRVYGKHCSYRHSDFFTLCHYNSYNYRYSEFYTRL